MFFSYVGLFCIQVPNDQQEFHYDIDNKILMSFSFPPNLRIKPDLFLVVIKQTKSFYGQMLKKISMFVSYLYAK